MYRVIRIALALTGIALLSFFAWDTARRGLEDWRSTKPRQEVRRWANGAVTSEANWLRTVHELRNALRLAPRNAEIWESLGLAYEIGSRRFAPAGNWTVYKEYALVHFRQAVALRPTAPYSWAGLAVIKYQLGQLDEEFSRALVAAMRYGPWEPAIQMIASDIGLALWDSLNVSFRELIRENWRRTAERQADQLAKLATAHGRAGLLCEMSLDTLKNRIKCPK